MQPNITLTATLTTLNGSADSNSQLKITLANYGQAMPTLVGGGSLAQLSQTFAFSNGQLSATLYGNDQINPVGTCYLVQMIDPSGNVIAAQMYQLTGTGTFNLSALTPYDPNNQTGGIINLVNTGQTFVPSGPWTVGQTFTMGAVVTYKASSYISLIANNTGNEPDTATSAWQLNAQGFNFRGAWQTNTAYSPNDIFIYAGSTYIVNAAFTSTNVFALSTSISSFTSGYSFRGAYGQNVGYLSNDTFTYNGSLYLVLTAFISGTAVPPAGNVSLIALGLNYRGLWTPNTAYNLGDVLSSGISSYYVLAAFTSGASFSTANLSLLSAGITYRGQWQPNTQYNQNDIFTYTGTTYYASAAFTSGATFSTANAGIYAAGFTFRAAYAQNVGYLQNDTFTYNGSLYVVLTAFTSGTAVPPAANVSILAQGFNYRGALAPSTAYNVFDVFFYGGATYLTTAAFTTGSTLSTPSAGNAQLISQGFNFRGPWTASTNFNPYDVLTYGGATYFVTTAFTSPASFSTTNLSLMLSAGVALSTTTPLVEAPTPSPGTAGDTTAAKGSHVHPINPAALYRFATPAAGVNATTGVPPGNYFHVPSASADGAFDTYQNVAGVAVFGQTIPKAYLQSGGVILSVTDPAGFTVPVVQIVGGVAQMPLVESRLEVVEASSSASAATLAPLNKLVTAQAGTAILTATDPAGFEVVIADNTGVAPALVAQLANVITPELANHAALIAALQSGSGTTSSSSTQAPSVLPVGGSSLWAEGGDAAAIDTVQGFLAFTVPQTVGDLQVGFIGSSGGQESPGPQMTLTASIEYPAGTFKQLFFQGRSSCLFDGGAIPLSDMRAIDMPAGAIGYVHFQVIRTPGQTNGINNGWIYGFLNGAGVMGSGVTNTRNGGNYWDTVEKMTTRTITDAVISGTNLTSQSAAFTPSEKNQTITFSDGSTGIYSYSSPTAATLVSAPNSGVTATAKLSATNKTMGAQDYYYCNGSTGGIEAFSPWVILGRVASKVPTFLVLGDSISWGYGLVGQFALCKGSWAVQGLNYGNGATGAVATAVVTKRPFINASQPGDTAYNIGNNHGVRMVYASKCAYTLGMLGTNDLGPSGTSFASLQASLLLLWTQLRLRGSKPVYATIIPRVTLASGAANYSTLANQVAVASTSVRQGFNTWAMDGCAWDTSTGLAVATGTTGATISRCNTYSTTGAQVTAASGPAHPCFAIIDVCSVVDTDGSGRFRVDLGTPTADGVHPTQPIHYVMASVVNAILPILV